MKGSLTVIGFFLLGVLLGYIHCLPEGLLENDLTSWILYALMFQVGISIGCDKKLKDGACGIAWRWEAVLPTIRFLPY